MASQTPNNIYLKPPYSKDESQIAFFVSRASEEEKGLSICMDSPGEDERSARSAGSETHSLLSLNSNTTFDDSDDDEPSRAMETFGEPKNQAKRWRYTFYRTEGNLHILGEWAYKSEAYRLMVIGPDLAYAAATFTIIVGPTVVAYLFLLKATWAVVVYSVLFAVCISSFLILFVSDPGLLRKYNHARNTKWTYCDFCSSFRPKGCVHCSTCKTCVADYDHHCAWTGKCVGSGNMFWFKAFTNSLSGLLIAYIIFVILSFIT